MILSGAQIKKAPALLGCGCQTHNRGRNAAPARTGASLNRSHNIKLADFGIKKLRPASACGCVFGYKYFTTQFSYRQSG